MEHVICADALGGCKDHLVFQLVGVQVFPFTCGKRLGAVLAVDLIVSFAFTLDLHDQALSILAPDDEIGGVVVHPAVGAAIFDEEIRFLRVGQRAGEVNIFHVIRIEFEQFQQVLEEVLLRP